jgi:hypothetical protein
MRAMVFDRYGEPDVMHLKDVPVSTMPNWITSESR